MIDHPFDNQTRTVEFFVAGVPGPQGSKISNGPGRGMRESSKKVKPWRADVRQAAMDALDFRQDKPLHDGRVTISIVFRFPRPKSHYGTGRNAETLKQSAPIHHTQKPDIDKLVRSTLDGLSGVAYTDDSRVATLRDVHKVWIDRDGVQGAEIIITFHRDDKELP